MFLSLRNLPRSARNMQIVVRQAGGLGNQLFQYAAGCYFAGKYSADLQMALIPLEATASDGSPRPVLLDRFNVSAQLRSWNRLDSFLLYHRRARLLRACLGVSVIEETQENQFCFTDVPVPPASRRVYLLGFWQAYPMVEAVRGRLTRDLTFRHSPSGKNLEVATKIMATENSVSIHLRRGDYKSFLGKDHRLPLEYYQNAVHRVLERGDNPTFFVFSDDADFARFWTENKNGFFHVDHNDANSAHEDLRLMSLCKHHIIANSTMSWWGAWLDSRGEGLVIAPAEWLGHPTADLHIAPPEWMLL